MHENIPIEQEQIQDQQPEQQQPAQEQAPEVAQAKPEQESPQAKNFRQLREKAERTERERNELLARLQQYEQRQQGQQSPEEDLSITLGNDELAEGKHISKLVKTVKKLESKVAQYEQKSSQLAAQALLKAQYPDFEQVVNTQAIESLKAEFPETAASLAANPDEYSRAVAAYKLIKRFGYAQQQDSGQYEEYKERIDKNMAKPRPLSSIAPQTGESPLSRVNAFEKGLTSELQQQLWKEMQEAMERG